MAKSKVASTTEPASGELPSRAKKQAQSKSSKAGLNVQVARINRIVGMHKSHGVRRVGERAPIALAAAVEYITSELFDVAKAQTLARKAKRITEDDILNGIRNDKQLHKLMAGVRALTKDKLDRTYTRMVVLPNSARPPKKSRGAVA